MAGDWIKWVKGLSRRAEVLAMAHALKTDRRIVACACMELWEWADTETTDGHIRGGSTAFVDGLVALPGFAGAIEAVGWLRSTDQGITLTRWDRHNSASAKKRATDADRQRTTRAKKQAGDPASGVSQNFCDKVVTKTVTREEKRRGRVLPVPPVHPTDKSSRPPREAENGTGDLPAAESDGAGKANAPSHPLDGITFVRDALVTLQVFPTTVDELLAEDMPPDVAEVRREWDRVCADLSVHPTNRQKVFVFRLFQARGRPPPRSARLERADPETRGQVKRLEELRRRKAGR